MPNGDLPSLIVTGASGVVGSHFLEVAKNDFLIYAIARRSQQESRIPPHPNIRWIQVDIGHWAALKRRMRRIKQLGGADFLLHLAGYYDFTYKDHPEYQRTNIKGTRHMVEQAKWLGVKRFIFASSLAACRFPKPGSAITEESLPDADYAYARSKAVGEELVRDASQHFPCTNVRLAAVFSDWCEYPPLYVFLETWLSGAWNARILGGRGRSAVTYIHVRDLARLFLTIFKKSHELPRYALYSASPDGTTTHQELFDVATRSALDRRVAPLHMPKMIAWPGVVARYALGSLLGRPPFERPWMMRYLDRQLVVDASATRRALGWEPTPRLHVLRRLLFLFKNLKSQPDTWHFKNDAAMKKSSERPHLMTYEILASMEKKIIAEVVDRLLEPAHQSIFPRSHELGRREAERYVMLVVRLLASVVRTGDFTLMLDYANILARRRFDAGYTVAELAALLETLREAVETALLDRSELEGHAQQIHDLVAFPMQLAIDGIEETYEHYLHQDLPPHATSPYLQPIVPGNGLAKVVKELDTLYRGNGANGNGGNGANGVPAGVERSKVKSPG